jgi:hypothetical protein
MSDDTRILPDDSNREDYPLYDGLFAYFPSALCEVARWSIVGNRKHNPGEPLHWAREKSADHENKILRHLLDARQVDKDGFFEAVALAWRALALCQTILEEHGYPEGANGKWKTKESPGVMKTARELIDTDSKYDAIMRRIEELMDAVDGTPEGEELSVLSDLIVNYELSLG